MSIRKVFSNCKSICYNSGGVNRAYAAGSLRFQSEQLYGVFPDIEFLQDSPIAFDLLGNSHLKIATATRNGSGSGVYYRNIVDINGSKVASSEINSNYPPVIIEPAGRIFVDKTSLLDCIANDYSNKKYNQGLVINTENVSDVYINDNFNINFQVSTNNYLEFSGMENVYIKGDISVRNFRLLVSSDVKKIVAPASLLAKIIKDLSQIPSSCKLLPF